MSFWYSPPAIVVEVVLSHELTVPLIVKDHENMTMTALCRSMIEQSKHTIYYSIS